MSSYEVLGDPASVQLQFLTGDFTGGGRTELMFYISASGDWWLGQLDNTDTLQWSRISTTSIVAPTTDQFLFFTGDLTGGNGTEVLFYYSGDNNWRLGQPTGNSLQWTVVSNTAGYGDLTGSQFLFFTGDFAGSGSTEVLFYYSGDNNWRLGQLTGGNSLQWSGVGNTAGFGDLTSGRFRFFTGDFAGSGSTEVLFYDGGDGNWWLGQLTVNSLPWISAGNTTGFGDLTGSQYRFFTGDFAGSGRTAVLFYFAGDGNWWLGQLDNSNALQWSQVGNTTGFGDLTGSQYRFFTGDFTGSGSTEVLFYYSGDGNWWLGRLDNSNALQWSQVGNTDLTGSQYLFFTGDFTGSGHSAVLFYSYSDGYWWLGQLENNALQWSRVGRLAVLPHRD